MALSPLDLIGFASLAVAAIFLAIRQGLNDVPAIAKVLPLKLMEKLNYLPLALVIVTGVLWAIQRANNLAANPPSRPTEAEIQMPNPIVVGIPYEYLSENFTTRTEIEAQRLAQPYIGRPLTVSGAVENVTQTSSKLTVVSLSRQLYNTR